MTPADFDLGRARYIALETYRRDGRPVRTPVGVVEEGGNLYVWTLADSGKVKRLRHTDRVRVCRCTVQGRPLGPRVEGRARLLEDPLALRHLERRMRAKYTLEFLLFHLLWVRLGRKRPILIEIRLEEPGTGEG